MQFDEIGSTNVEALNGAKVGIDGNVWYVTKRQNAGKGRLGRKWLWVDGNLTASLLLRIELEPAKCAMLGFVAGVALVNTLKSFDENLHVQLKWPNDILLNGGKLAGILLEMKSLTNKEHFVAIGFGVNIAGAPKGLPYLATSLKDNGLNISVFEFFERLSEIWVKAYQKWNNGKGSAKLLQLWCENAKGIGQTISIKNHNRVITGIFENIDADGRLIIMLSDGTREYISAGDMYFGIANSNRRE